MKKKAILYLVAVIILIVTPLSLAKVNIKTIADEVIIARATLKPLPHISVRYPDFDPEKAYAVQKLVVNRLKSLHNAKVRGFKAAFTDPVSQKNFGMKEPAYGVLLDYMILEERKPDLDVKVSKRAIKPMIEVEIGFILKKDINNPIKNINELKEYIKSGFIAIEIPDIRFDLKGLKGSDLIADDAGTFLVIKGKEFDPFKVDLAKVEAKLYFNGKVVVLGSGKNVLGNPLNSLLWLVNKALSQGETLKKGHIIITGTMTKMVPANPGSYVAVYGDLGSLKFNIK